MKIAIAGMGYVGLSQAVLLAQHNSVCVVDVAAEKVDMLNRGISPIQDSYLDAYLNKPHICGFGPLWTRRMAIPGLNMWSSPCPPISIRGKMHSTPPWWNR